MAGKKKRKIDDGRKIVARNKRAHALYDIERSFEAGMVLQGTEVKSLRAGNANLRDSYAAIQNGEVFLHNAHFSPYAYGNRANHDPQRPRKLLLKKSEIKKLIGKVQIRGYSLIPLDLYFNKRGKAKLTLALAKGKRPIDRREDIKRKDMDRDMERSTKYKY